MSRTPNVNVTLSPRDRFEGKPFPCPICGTTLGLRVAQTGKPYCHCDACGIQLFFRGKVGIQKLEKLLATETLASGKARATVVYNRLQQLKAQKARLQDQRNPLFPDPDLDRAIAKTESEIRRVRKELRSL